MDLDPAAVMAAHAEHIQLNGKCEHGWPKWRAFASDPHCEPYRLAEALAASEARLSHVEECWRETNAECVKHWNRADLAEAKLARMREAHRDCISSIGSQ